MLAPYQTIADGELNHTGERATLIPDPIAIGAVGGSGTRAMVKVLEGAGVAMASPLNRAGDAIEWPPFSRLITPEAIERHSREKLIKNILHGFESLLNHRRNNLGLDGRVSWKVPGTFLWLEEFASYFPRLQYIHLVRHGLDMAYSHNRNQVNNWASHFDIEVERSADGAITPYSTLEYWLRANEYVLSRGRELLGERLVVVRFEELCEKPDREIRRILDSLGLPTSDSRLQELAGLIIQPSSTGRYRAFNWRSDFSHQQLRRLQALSYAVEDSMDQA